MKGVVKKRKRDGQLPVSSSLINKKAAPFLFIPVADTKPPFFAYPVTSAEIRRVVQLQLVGHAPILCNQCDCFAPPPLPTCNFRCRISSVCHVVRYHWLEIRRMSNVSDILMLGKQKQGAKIFLNHSNSERDEERGHGMRLLFCGKGFLCAMSWRMQNVALSVVRGQEKRVFIVLEAASREHDLGHKDPGYLSLSALRLSSAPRPMTTSATR